MWLDFKGFWAPLSLGFAALLAPSCGSSVPLPSSSYSSADTVCSTGVAQILIWDGYSQRLCGCAEAANTVFASGSPLTCTVTAGTVVHFQLVGDLRAHQIVSTGTPSFISSPVFREKKKKKYQPLVHAVKFTASGNYTYIDAFFNGVSGTISVP